MRELTPQSSQNELRTLWGPSVLLGWTWHELSAIDAFDKSLSNQTHRAPGTKRSLGLTKVSRDYIELLTELEPGLRLTH